MSMDIYNINNYSEKELYAILDMTNPSDRELEAKILHMIWKYDNMQNESGNRLSRFFKDIYDFFFKNEEDGEDEDEYKDENTSIIENFTSKETPNATVKGDSPSNAHSNAPSNAPSTMPIVSADKTDGRDVKYSVGLDYSKDKLNPLLKQTIKRILSIDSQYREDKSSMSTDFTFNLSDSLRDVVSIKLYSIQIPYTWYTINSNFGSNVFYLKGNSPGVNNGSHDIKISIPVGNYTAPELIAATRKSIISLQTNPLYTDINFGNTDISYNYANSKSTLTLDLSNTYNEMYYSLYFSKWTSSFTDISRNQSIPSFFGLNQGDQSFPYYSFRIYSDYSTLPMSGTIAYNNEPFYSNYLLTNMNNYFTVVQYIGNAPSTEYISDPSNCRILNTFKITFGLDVNGGRSYSRPILFNDLNKQLSNNTYLFSSSNAGSSSALGISQIKRVDVSDNIVTHVGNGFSHYELDIILNRYTVQIVPNSKVAVIFPNETANIPIWTGLQSAFVFTTEVHELSTIISETTSIQKDYNILSEPYIYLECKKPYFSDVSLNNYIIQIANSSVVGYKLDEYIDAINTAINNTNDTTITFGNPRGVFDSPNNTNVSIIPETSFFNLRLDITKNFTQKNYVMDISGTFMNTILNLSDGNNIGIDLSSNNIFTSVFPIIGSGYNFAPTQDVSYVMMIRPNPTGGNQRIPTYYISLDPRNTNPPSYFYSSLEINILQNDLKTAFSKFTDEDGSNVLSSTEFSLTVDGNNINMDLKLNISKTITEQDYQLSFIDPSANNVWDSSANSWSYYLGIPQQTYDLSGAALTVNNYSSITGTRKVLGDNITLDSTNNTIFISPINPMNASGLGDGLYSSDNANGTIITIPPDTYTRTQLINRINTLLNTGYSVGTTVSTTSLMNNNIVYGKIRLNMNRVYTIVDYRLVFYDPFSFVQFFTGTNSIKNTTWDATLGWILGFRNATEFYFSSKDANIGVLVGDTVVSVTIYNYFMILLNDYNLNHLNDGLVTTTQKENIIPIPSYISQSEYRVDPVSGKLIAPTVDSNVNNVNAFRNNLTRNQIYSAQEIINTQRNVVTSTSGANNSYYSSGPFANDVFALLPIKVAGLQNNSVYVDYGGTLQNQERVYFGPVNISRLSIKLINDKGEVVDLNNANWSCSLIVEQLYQQNKI
jgi:hypothetical protein